MRMPAHRQHAGTGLPEAHRVENISSVGDYSPPPLGPPFTFSEFRCNERLFEDMIQALSIFAGQSTFRLIPHLQYR